MANTTEASKVRFVVIQINDDATSSTQNFTSLQSLMAWSRSLLKSSSSNKTFAESLRQEILAGPLTTVYGIKDTSFMGSFWKNDFDLSFSFVIQDDHVAVEFITHSLFGKPYTEKYRLPLSIELIVSFTETMVKNFTLEKAVKVCVPGPVSAIDENHFLVGSDGNICTLEINFPNCILTDKNGKVNRFDVTPNFRANLHDVKAKLEALTRK